MSQFMMIDGYVRSLLVEMTSIEDLGPRDGRYEVTFSLDAARELLLEVTVRQEGSPRVEARCTAVTDIDLSQAVLERLNGLNAVHSPPSVVHAENAVHVQGSRPADGLDPDELGLLLDDVVGLSRKLAVSIPADFGGRANVVAQEPVNSEPRRVPDHVGGYL